MSSYRNKYLQEKEQQQVAEEARKKHDETDSQPPVSDNTDKTDGTIQNHLPVCSDMVESINIAVIGWFKGQLTPTFNSIPVRLDY